LAGFLMTPDAAFGFERRGTPDALAALGRRDGFEVVVVPPFTLDGESIRSSAIRDAVAAGDLRRADRLLGRPFAITGSVGRDGRLGFALPMSLPPNGRYPCEIHGNPASMTIESGQARLETPIDPNARVEVTFCP
jgi:FAD synthase